MVPEEERRTNEKKTRKNVSAWKVEGGEQQSKKKGSDKRQGAWGKQRKKKKDVRVSMATNDL